MSTILFFPVAPDHESNDPPLAPCACIAATELGIEVEIERGRVFVRVFDLGTRRWIRNEYSVSGARYLAEALLEAVGELEQPQRRPR
jgi:hypothetical protein